MPIPALKAAADAAEVTIFGIDEADVPALLRRFPSLSAATVPAGSYRGQTAPVRSVAAWNFVVAHKDMPDAVAARLTRIALSSADPARDIHASAAGTRRRERGHQRRAAVPSGRAGGLSRVGRGGAVRGHGRRPHHISLIPLKLACPSRPTMMWSWTAMPIAFATSTISLVMRMSAWLGVGSPEGWLWTRMMAVEESSSARRTISRG